MEPMIHVFKWTFGLCTAAAMAGVFLGFYGPMVFTSTNEQGTFGSAFVIAPVMAVLGAVAGAVVGYLTRNVDLG